MSTRRILVCGPLLLALILFVAQAGVSADETAPPKVPVPPKVVQPPQPPQPPNLPPGLDPADVQKRLEEFRKRLEEQRKNKGAPPAGWGGGKGGFRSSKTSRLSPQRGRLGADLTRPTKVLVDQLDLPKSKGMVLERVEANSAAAKAGLKASDILLEIDGKAVPSTPTALDKMLEGIKANKAVDVVVMRRGKKETIKGLTLPEPKAEAPARPPRGGAQRNPLPIPPNQPNPPVRGGFGTTRISRINDQFTATRTTNTLTLVVKGKMNQGQATVTEVTVTENGQTNTYAGLDKVPAAQQAAAKSLAKLAETRDRAPRNRGR